MIEGLTTRIILSPNDGDVVPGWKEHGLPTIIVEGPVAPAVGMDFFMEGVHVTKVLTKGMHRFVAYATVTDSDAWECLLAFWMPGRERHHYFKATDCYDSSQWYAGTKL